MEEINQEIWLTWLIKDGRNYSGNMINMINKNGRN